MNAMSAKTESLETLLKRHKYIVGLLLCTTVCAIYVYFALRINGNLLGTTSHNYYSYLLDSFFHGRVNVNPPSNYDLSLFQNKWYLYWGPAPVLFILPFYLISHLQASDILSTLIGGASNVILFYFVMQAFKRYFNISLSLMAEAFLLFSFGLASPNFILSLHGDIWFTSQIFAATYLLLFYLCFFLFLNTEKLSLFILAVVFFWLAFLSRYSLVFNGILFFFVIAHFRLADRKVPLQLFVSFGVLTLAFVGLGCLYNYARFGNILDVGQTYQQGAHRYDSALQSGHYLSLSYVWHNVYYYFLNIVHFQPTHRPVVVDKEGNSVFSVYPALLLSPMLFYCRQYVSKKRLIFLGLAAAVVALCIILLMLYFATGWVQFGSRYFFDVIPLLFLSLMFILEYVPNSVQLAILLFGIFINFYGTLAFFGK
ncbi:MAG: hypothetical protein WCD86_14115 [Ktedonobacteraceae bacterium]